MSSRLKLVLATFFVVATFASLAGTHPHFRKALVARMPDLEVKLEYTTYPWNPVHLAEVKDGFVFRGNRDPGREVPSAGPGEVCGRVDFSPHSGAA
jgi:hypothetical protein